MQKRKNPFSYNMKIVIVGAGITGCIAGIELAKLKHDVHIYESCNEIGGILRDAIFDEDIFFNSCHYLNNDASWVQNLLKDYSFNILKFDHVYGSFTEYENKKVVCNESAIPTFNINETTNYISNNYSLGQNDSINNRFGAYPKCISSFLKKWFNQFQVHDSKYIHENGSIATQCNRVYLKGQETNINKLKDLSTIIDSLYGIPRKKLNKSKSSLKAILPIKGYNYFFNELKKVLLDNSCNLNLGSTVRPYFDDNQKLNIVCNKKQINYDAIIWAANPVPIIFKSGYGKLDNPFCKMKIFHFNISDTNIINPKYIQIFSLKSLITRIFVYNINNCNKVTVETIYTDKDPIKELDFISSKAIELLKSFNYPSDICFAGAQIQKRHIFYTKDDFNKINSFENDYNIKFPNFVGGGYLEYGRDQKINSILNKFHSLQMNYNK